MNGEAQIMDKGIFSTSLRASMAIPILFDPVKINEARIRQTKNIGAIVDDLVTMSNEYHRVIRMLGCQTIHQYRLGLCVKC